MDYEIARKFIFGLCAYAGFAAKINRKRRRAQINRHRKQTRPTHGEGNRNINRTIEIKLQRRKPVRKHTSLSARGRFGSRIRAIGAVTVFDRTMRSDYREVQAHGGEQTTQATNGIQVENRRTDEKPCCHLEIKHPMEQPAE